MRIRTTDAYIAAADSILNELAIISRKLDGPKGLSARETKVLFEHLRQTSGLFQAHRPGSGFELTGLAYRKAIVLRNAVTRIIAAADDFGVSVPGDTWLNIQQFPDVAKSPRSRSAKDAVIGAYQPSRRLLESLKSEAEIKRFEKHQAACIQAFKPFTPEHVREFIDHAHYRWSDWTLELASRFAQGIPLNFLHDDLLSCVMVAWGRPVEFLREILHLESRHSRETLARVLREHYIGMPAIVSRDYVTSHNTQVQYYHLDRYVRATGNEPIALKVVVEWGGGYGVMARILKKINPDVTYSIVDLPPICGLQAAYLTSIFGSDAVHLVASKSSKIQKGKINIVPVHLSGEVLKGARPDLFISITALTESSPFSQAYVSKVDFFGARGVLLGFEGEPRKHQTLLPAVATMKTEGMNLTAGAPHYYAFR